MGTTQKDIRHANELESFFKSDDKAIAISRKDNIPDNLDIDVLRKFEIGHWTMVVFKVKSSS